MKILTNKKLDIIASNIIELQKVMNDLASQIEPITFIKIVDSLSNIAVESLDLHALNYVNKTLWRIKGE